MDIDTDNINQHSNIQFLLYLLCNGQNRVKPDDFKPNIDIQYERFLLPNGIYEKRYQNGSLVESVSIVLNPEGGWMETKFNSQGERLSFIEYQNVNTPIQLQLFKNDEVFQTKMFKRDKDGVLLSQTTDADGEVISLEEYNDNFEVVNAMCLEDDEIIGIKTTEIDEEGLKHVKHISYKNKTVLAEVFNKEGEAIGEYHYKDNELERFLEVYIDDKGFRHVKEWNKKDPSHTFIHIFDGKKCVARRIFEDEKYVGFIECIYDSTSNHYEMLYDTQGNRISCSTYNENNQLIKRDYFKDGEHVSSQTLPVDYDDSYTRES